MSLYARLGLSFDTTRFGSAQTLSTNAANTLGLIANTSGPMPQWQQTDLSTGSPVRTNYFQNPTTNTLTLMLSAANNLYVAANTANDFITAADAQSLIIEIGNFQSKRFKDLDP